MQSFNLNTNSNNGIEESKNSSIFDGKLSLSCFIELQLPGNSRSITSELIRQNDERESQYEEGPGVEIIAEDSSYHEEPGDDTESVMELCMSRQDNEEDLREEELDKNVALKFTPTTNTPGNERAKTAPARPLTEIEELKNSKEFANLEAAAVAGSQLIQKSDGKFDIDSEEGQKNCKTFLQELEQLFKSFKVQHAQRKYREKFSQAYKALYVEGELCYLTEILDSAQEGFPFLWVNSEKYIFSPNVLNSAKELFSSFSKLKHVLRNIFNRVCEENPHTDVTHIICELRSSLYSFDKLWAHFERVIFFIR